MKECEGLWDLDCDEVCSEFCCSWSAPGGLIMKSVSMSYPSPADWRPQVLFMDHEDCIDVA